MGSVFTKSNLLLLGVCVLLFSLNLWRGLYADEVITWNTTRLPLDELVQDRLVAGHLPAWFVLEWAWVKLVGDSEIGLRGLSVLFAIAGVFAVRAMTKKMFGDERFALMAALILAIHQLTVWSAQTARPYAPLLFFAPLAVYTLMQWWTTGERKHLAGLAAACIFGLSIQAMFWPFAVAVCITLVLFARNKGGRSVAALAMIMGSMLLVSPTLLALGGKQQSLQSQSWSFPIAKIQDAFSHVFLGDFTLVHDKDIWMYLLLALGALCLYRAVNFLRSAPNPYNFPRGALLLLWAAIPFACLFAAQAAGNSILAHERYFVILLPPIAITITAATWQRANLFRVVLVVLGIITTSWITKPGDGSKRFANEIGTPQAITGKAGPLIYEYRHDEVDLRYSRVLERGELEERVTELADQYSEIWLVVFDNKKSKLDILLASPPPPWKPVKRVEHGHMRGVLLRLAGE